MPDFDANTDFLENGDLVEVRRRTPAGDIQRMQVPFSDLASAATAAHNASATAHGLRTYAAENYGTISATEPVSHLAIQAAIDAAHAGGIGTVLLPPGKMLLGASLIPRSGVTIRGASNTITSTGKCFDLIWSVTGGSILSFPNGVVFQRNEIGFSTTDYLERFDLENVGFDNCKTILKCGGRSYNGWSGSVARNVYGSNITGWAFDLVNYQHIRLDNIFLSAIGGLRLAADLRAGDIGTSGLGPGNSTFIDVFIKQPQSGAIYDGVLIEVVDGADSPLAVGSFYRLQVNRFNPTATDTCNVRVNGRTPSVVSAEFHDLDLEGTALASFYGTGMTRGGVRFSGVSTATTPWACILENCIGVAVSGSQVGAKIKCLDNSSAAFMTLSGIWGQAGELNRRPRGFYLDQSRGANAFQCQFSIYDTGCLKGEDFTLTWGSTLEFSGARIKRRVVAHTGGALPEDYASDIVKLSTAASSTAVPSAVNCATECTRYINTSAGSVTITGVTGGNITLAAGSVCDVQAISGAWYLVNKHGS